MHKPSSCVADLEILPFRSCLTPSGKGEAFDRAKWLYMPDYYCDYRYILGTVGENPLICIGINPSTAFPEHLDNTLKSVERIAHGNGYDSFIMFNVSAQRATSPQDMDREPSFELHRENMEAFSYILSLSNAPVVWAAWGTIVEKRSYLRKYLSEMVTIGERFGAKWMTAGACSKQKGHPHHPLYLKKDEKLVPFQINEYLENLTK